MSKNVFQTCITFRDELPLKKTEKSLILPPHASFEGAFPTVKRDLIGQSQYLQPFKIKGIMFSLIVVVNFLWLLN